ncbi:DUF2382 domain-containing protein [Spirillospora sp. CA-294931]|uniref:DUF2382 domain-containing protein n=1 Tax=Spirillospora sp. CA-294931 TaxID=3240042 RepID=UPI003D943EB9
MTTQDSGLIGMQVVGNDGEEIGTVSQIIGAEGTGEPEWLVLKSGLFGMRERVAPYAGARSAEGKIMMPMGRNIVRESPHVDLDDGLTAPDEEMLVRHYGRGPHGAMLTQQSQQASGMKPGASPMAGSKQSAPRPTASTAQRPTAAPAAASTSTAAGTGRVTQGRQQAASASASASGDVEVVRYEQRMSVAKEQEEAGRVRIRKVIESEPFEQTVACMSEDYEVIREPIKDGRPATHEMVQDEQEMILHRERLIVTKVSIPVERVRLRRKMTETHEKVRETLAKERIEVDKVDIPSQPSSQARTRGSSATR